MRPVTMYMCSAECSGTVTPASRPTALAHWPAQLITTSALMSPRVVATPVATPSFCWIAVTRVCSKMRAPFMRAPRASACVTSAGLTLASSGSQSAPSRSSVRITGYFRRPRSIEMISQATPCARAAAWMRLNRVTRSGVRATRTEPHCFQPVACPVSASSFW